MREIIRIHIAKIAYDIELDAKKDIEIYKGQEKKSSFFYSYRDARCRAGCEVRYGGEYKDGKIESVEQKTNILRV